MPPKRQRSPMDDRMRKANKRARQDDSHTQRDDEGDIEMTHENADPLPPFLRLPLEIRSMIYGHVLKLPGPIKIRKYFRFATRIPTLPLVQVCGQVRDELMSDFHSIWARENVICCDYRNQAFTNTVDRASGASRRLIKHIRLINSDLSDTILDRICEGNVTFRRLFSKEENAFNNWLEDFDRRRGFTEFIPGPMDLIRLSRDYLPNLKTLTLDIGRIDHLGPTITDDWLEEPQHSRDRRYRVVIQHISRLLPDNVRGSLSVTVKARMDPVHLMPSFGFFKAVLHVDLTYSPRQSDDAVQVVEHLPAWSREQNRSHRPGRDFVYFPDLLVRRVMPMQAPQRPSRAIGVLFSQGYKPYDPYEEERTYSKGL